jgi:predicted nucleic acid-binding protein
MRRPWSIENAWSFVAGLIASPGFSVLVPTTRHASVAAEVFRELPHLAGNIVQDAHTAILSREHGVSRICTRDTDFSRFPFLEVVDPLTV